MAALKNNNTPQFVLFPINNDRTAWKKFGLPVILVVPHRRDLSGNQLANSKVRNVKIFIEDVPSQALVSGHQHIGKRFPDRELYRETVDYLELADRQIDIINTTITRNDVVVSNIDAKNGDILHYTTSTGIVDTIPYLKHADYYDLSDFKIDVEILPDDIYNLVYEATYFPRKSAFGEVDQLLCIDTSYEAIAQLRFKLNHPGDVIAEMHNLTPPVYLTTATKAEDTTLSFYRPFSDILQDVTDEQALLERVNWVHDIVPEAFPYLSHLLGWGVPYFPQSVAALRRAILRRTTHIQKLKGSSKAVHEIFRLFGFELLTQNLWWSDDGKRLIAPGEKLPFPYESLEIKKRTISQVDLLLNEWQTDGYGDFKIPLLFRPLQADGFDKFIALREGGNVTVDAYLVKKDGAAHLKLKAIAESISSDPKGYGDSSGGHTVDNAGFLNPVQLHSELSGIETVGYSQVLLTGKLGESTDSVLTGTNIPLSNESCEYDRDDNILSLTFNGHKTFIKDKTVLYAFATYARDEFVVPSELADLQSNKFNIQVVTSELESRLMSIAGRNAGEWNFHGAAVPNSAGLVSTTVLDFALDFLFKAKAFHSQLHVVKYAIDLTETYEVTDMCVGGDTAQRYDTPMGRLQVPPAIIPNVPADGPDCANSDPVSLGYKNSDILLRLRKLANLPEEHAAWKAYDDREIYQVGPTRLILPPSASGRTECKYTHLGQDRITGSIFTVSSVEHNPNPNSNQGTRVDSNLDLSPVDDITNGASKDTSAAASSNNNSELFSSFMKESNGIRDAHCDLDSITDFCYKGRVDDEILYRISNVNSEAFRCKPCKIGMGFGAYWSYPMPTKRVIHGNDALCLRGIMNDGRGTLSVYSGGAAKPRLIGHLESKPLENTTSESFTSAHDAMLSSSYDKPLAKEHNSYLGRLYQNYDIPSSTTLHYHNRPSSPEGDQTLNLAFQRPGLDVQKETLHLPGCRFATMDSLRENYTNISIKAKPWDDAFSTHCGPANLCVDEPTYLNAKLIKDSDGDMMLSYNNQSYIVYKNGLEPDIPSLGSHVLGTTDATFDSDDVVHEVYLDDAVGHAAITLDSVCAYDTAAIGSDELIETNTLMFDSGSLTDRGTDISTASFSKVSSSLNSQDGDVRDVKWNNDGTKMFMLGRANDSVYEYSASTAFDVSTITYVRLLDIGVVSATQGDDAANSIEFNTDGTKLFVLGQSQDKVDEYALSTGFDLSTASFTHSFSVASQELQPYGLAFNNDGTKMFVTGWVGDDINEYTLSTGFNVSTATFVDSYSVSSECAKPSAVQFDSDGTTMYVLNGTGAPTIFQYELTTGFDVSTASYSSKSFSTLNEESKPRGFCFGANGTKLYVAGWNGDDINQYTLALTSYLDYAGGYPCIKGFVDYDDPDLGRSGLYTDLFTALGVENASNTATQVLFLLGSGIIVEKGVRMDCGCKVVEYDGSEATTFCSTSLFLNDDSEYEWGCDHISVDNIAVLDETIGTCSFRQNGELPSLLETV